MQKRAASGREKRYRPVHLGRRSNAPCTRIDRIPWAGRPIVVTLDCSEFTSLCPVTGQPDFAQLQIRYEPAAYLVETKSLKLYLWHFRDRGAFNEELVAAIADDLFDQLRPKWIEVAGRFHARGGIAVAATARRPLS